MPLTLEEAARLLPGLQTMRDLIAKAEYDLDRFAKLDAEPFRSWALADVVDSLWHALDWSHKLYEAKSFPKLSDWRDEVAKVCPQILWLGDIGIAAKHRIMDRDKHSDVEGVVVSAAPIPEEFEYTNLGTSIIRVPRRQSQAEVDQMLVHKVRWGGGQSDAFYPHLLSVLRYWEAYLDDADPQPQGEIA